MIIAGHLLGRSKRRLCQVCRYSSQARPAASLYQNLQPKAADEQIFIGKRSADDNSSVGTEEEWQEAIARLEKDESDSHIVPKNDAAIFASNRIGQVPLPPGLTACINSILKGTHGPSLRSTSLRFYESLKLKREGKTSHIPMPASKDFDGLEALAFVAGFTPQIYASCTTVLLELRKRLGTDFRPTKVLDYGLGPGTAGLAFQEAFVTTNPVSDVQSPCITIVQENDEMRKICERIWSTTVPDSSFDIRSRYNPTSANKFDVVMAPHVLGDLKGRPADRDVLVRNLWSCVSSDGGVLLLLERGNPQGFENIARAREVLLRSLKNSPLAQGKATETGHIIAPCPHDAACPLYTADLGRHLPDRAQWCHFSQRLQRPDFLQRLKRASGNVEDVGYSYLLIRKGMERPAKESVYRYSNHTRRVVRARPSVDANEDVDQEQVVENDDDEVDDTVSTRTSSGKARSSDDTERNIRNQESLKNEEIVLANYHWPRIIMPPLKRHKHILIDTCSPPPAPPQPSRSSSSASSSGSGLRLQQSGGINVETERSEEKENKTGRAMQGQLERHTVPKSQGPEEYKFARRSHWGDSLPFGGKTKVPGRILDSVAQRAELTKRQGEKEKERERVRRDREREKEEKRHVRADV